MADRLKEIPAKILEWWNKFTSKQKTIIISIAAAVIFTFAIIIYVISRPQYVQLYVAANNSEAAKIVNILEAAGVSHRESSDGLTIEVNADQEAIANLAMGSAGYTPDTVNLDDYMDYSISTTSSDREKMYKEYKEAKLRQAFMAIEAVEDAYVLVDLGPQNGTLIAQDTDASAYIQLTLSNTATFTSANATAMARAAASFLNTSSTANITILDQNGTVLFTGGDDYMAIGYASTVLELQSQAESMLNSQVKRVLLGTKQFDLIDAVSHLTVDYSESERTIKEYSAPDGRTEGMLASSSGYESSGTNGVDGSPGTDSNGSDLTTYDWLNGTNSEYSTKEYNNQYLPNELIEYQKSLAGSIDYANSSLSISMISYHDYYEESVRRAGLLEDMTWEEFKYANRADVPIEVSDDYYALAANATGISQNRITIIAYESPVFHDKEGFSVSATDVLSIVMIILILALLAFVVLRSMRTKKGEEEEEELSVESMLQSTADQGLEDLEVETKSEVRLLIEKFVDENPEAAANLLRNWLNEDWG